jgi:lipoic acid synthetase
MQSHYPQWLKKRITYNADLAFTRSVLTEFGAGTVCQAARCPNIFDCFSRRTATFLILGDVCTRNCAFCFVKKGRPFGWDVYEPLKIAEISAMLGLKRVVITSVARDDLSDGGSGAFSRTINAVRGRLGSEIKTEVLVPDFQGRPQDVKRVVDAAPDVFGHNVETVPRLYATVRPQADYKRSLDIFRIARRFDPRLVTKSGIMVGLGETEGEIKDLMNDLIAAGCDMLSIGQYLRPSAAQVEVSKIYNPEDFSRFNELGRSLGFKDVHSGPFVRSSLA